MNLSNTLSSDNDIFIFKKFMLKLNHKIKYLSLINKKIDLIKLVKNTNYKKLDITLKSNGVVKTKRRKIVLFVISIYCLRKNTMFHFSEHGGRLLSFFSAGSLKFKGKSKKSRYMILKQFRKALLRNFKQLRGKPTALHIYNADSDIDWIINRIKSKFFVTTVQSLVSYPHNGCRKPKKRRKKFRTKKKPI